ncbi:MAG: polymerase, sigma-24 subunit, subfamily [Verrucomicrobiales bacterium]|nr:polymerase, sigma-24 subunit, subfamily [Verrucomicrobiales bacterium]
MPLESDSHLLRKYAEHGEENAFSELVNRHTNLVYSAALRQVASADLAAEICQVVFISLAHDSKKLISRFDKEASLSGWLCRTARNVAINLRRTDYRRYSREKEAMQQLNSDSHPAPDWASLAPVLDDAMAELKEADYDALVMRFYENQDFHSVGRSLGVSDDTAQKRVARALDKLREVFSRRSIKATAATLSIILSANAVQAAPIGLAASLSTAALLAGSATPTAMALTSSKTLVMTTLQKSLIAASLTLAIGTGIFESRQTAIARNQSQLLSSQLGPLSQQVAQLMRDRIENSNKLEMLKNENELLKRDHADLLKLRAEASRLRGDSQELAQIKTSDAGGTAESAAKSWANRASLLRRRVEQNLDANIPELRLATDQDWLDAAKGELNSEQDIRRAMSLIRGEAENKAAQLFQKSLKAYMKDSHDQFPQTIADLQPYLDSKIDGPITQRWQVAPASAVPNVGVGSDWIITQKAPIDPEYDRHFVVGVNGFGSSSYDSTDIKQVRESITELRGAMNAYKAANPGSAEPDNPNALLPYITTAAEKSALENLIKNSKKSATN